MIDALFFTAAASYGVASALFLAYLSGARARPGIAALVALVISTIFHLAHELLRWMVLGISPLAGIAPALSTLALLVAGTFLIIRRGRPKLEVVGAFVTPISLAMFLASRAQTHGALAGGALIAVHISTSLLGLAAFSVACAMAVAFLIQERQLKARRLGGLFHRLPPLDLLDSYAHRCIAVGLPALTLGVITGHVVAARGSHVGGLPWQQYFAMVSWALFVAVLLLRMLLGWRGRRAAIGTILGYASSVAVLLFYVARGGRA